MYPVSAAFLEALRSDHTLISSAIFTDPFTGLTTDIPIKSGSFVTVDISAACRRMLTLVTPPTQSIFDAISTPGGEIAVSQTLRYPSRALETVPLGKFQLSQQAFSYRPDGQLQITAPDRWYQVQQNRFGLVRTSVASNLAWAEIKRLVEGAWPNVAYPFPGWSSTFSTAATTKVGSVVWDDGSRENAIKELLKANSMDMYFDNDGLGVLRPIPNSIDSTPAVWLLDASETGVLIDAERQVDYTSVHNAVIVSSSATDIILTPVEVKNTHAAASDHLSTLGPLGYRAVDYQSPLIRNTAQALAAGKTILQQQLQAAAQLSTTSVPNPALDGWDVVDVLYPPGDYGTTRLVEHRVIESTAIPLTPTDAQTTTMRSTRPTLDDSV